MLLIIPIGCFLIAERVACALWWELARNGTHVTYTMDIFNCLFHAGIVSHLGNRGVDSLLKKI